MFAIFIYFILDHGPICTLIRDYMTASEKASCTKLMDRAVTDKMTGMTMVEGRRGKGEWKEGEDEITGRGKKKTGESVGRNVSASH